MSAAVLSRHVVSVPPRQTVREAVADGRAVSLRLTKVTWDPHDGHAPDTGARDVLYLASQDVLALDEDVIGLNRQLSIQIGNCSDTPILVEFEIRGVS